MGAAASACCTRRSPDFGIDEVPPEQIGREVSQFSAENPSSIGSIRSPVFAGDDVERQRVALGPAESEEQSAGGRHWAKLRQSFHDGMGGRRSALKQLRRTQSRLSLNSTTTGRSNHTAGPWGGSEARGQREFGPGLPGPRIPADRRSSGGSDGHNSISSRIDAIYEDDGRYIRSSEAANMDPNEHSPYGFERLLRIWRQPYRAWSALRCFVVVISSTTLLLLVSAPGEEMDRLIQALAIMTTVSASILSALAKAPAEWYGNASPLWKDYMQPVSEKSDRTLGSFSNEFQPSASNSDPLYKSEDVRRKRVGSETDMQSTSGDSGIAYRARRNQDDDGFGTRFSGEAEIIDYPNTRTPTSPQPRMHALARSASQTSLGLALAIKQQRAVLDSVAVQLEEAEEEVLMRGQMEEEQHELLRNFRRIVSRDVGLVADPPNAHIVIVAKADQSRASLSNICDDAKLKYRAFASMVGAKKAVAELGQANRDSSLKRSASRALQAPEHDFRAHCFTRSFNRLEEAMVTIVLLSAEWLIDGEERREVPREWHTDGIFIAITCSEEELCQISNLYVEDIPNPSDFEILEALREGQGIREVLTMPACAEDLRNTVMEALHQRFAEDYLLLQQVGRGSFASVHKAKRMSDGQLFALKEVHLRRLGPSGLEMVEQEAKLLRAMQWPTVLFLIDTWVHEGTRYFLTPLLTGGDIAGKCEAAKNKGLDSTPIEACRAFNWYVQTLHAIAYLHWRGVLHTDLKPQNLLLGGNSLLVQVADLGSALILPGQPPHPALKNAVKADIRTRLYTSPETMDTLTHTCASDMWAIGTTYYEVFTLKSVASANMNASVMLQELKKNASPETLLKNLIEDGNFVGLPPAKVEELKKQLVDLLSLSPERRPSCISLLMQPIVHQCLRNVMLEVGAFSDKNAEGLHEQNLQEMHTCAAAAKNREPPFQDTPSAPVKQVTGRDQL
mmetsp:Transcript_56146/g.131456  ORF Transcript_56146/g.131456 Transcript_56146/m.131456 type:complete len:959 (-) Transcript_56146:139-3015(-)